jgi:hypothetical protein
MTVIFVSIVMWLLAASLLILRRGRAERNITYAAVTIAVAMTLNTDPVYSALDTLAGGANLVTLGADIALMIGVYFLGRAVMKASEHQPRVVRIALGRLALVASTVSAVIAFMLIHRGASTTNFMIDLGDQPAAATYSIVQFVYYGIVLGAMAVLAARQLQRSYGAQRIPPAALLAGSIFGVLLSVAVITMDLAHVVDDLDLMSAVSTAYEPLRLFTFLLLCFGFASQPAVSAFQARSRERTTRKFVSDLAPVWIQATRARPGIRPNQLLDFPVDEPGTRLHRQVVEIRDAMMDPRVSFTVNRQDRALLERAERHLLGVNSTEAPTGDYPAVVKVEER